jgi:hypothetical protein
MRSQRRRHGGLVGRQASDCLRCEDALLAAGSDRQPPRLDHTYGQHMLADDQAQLPHAARVHMLPQSRGSLTIMAALEGEHRWNAEYHVWKTSPSLASCEMCGVRMLPLLPVYP